jgi:hypothetical protein
MSDYDKDPTRFFTVVGAPYVPERHVDESPRHRRFRGYSEGQPPETGVAALWLVFYAVIFGFSLFASGGAARLIEVANVALKWPFNM